MSTLYTNEELGDMSDSTLMRKADQADEMGLLRVKMGT